MSLFMLSTSSSGVWRRHFPPLLVTFTGRMSQSVKRSNSDDSGNKAKKQATGHWANGLLGAMDDPNLRVYDDSQVVVIKDKYPKAQFHFLILPKQSIPNLKALNKEHLELLQHMHDIGCEIAQKKEHRNRKFKLGYHAEPSMHHLHMHLISDDFCSDCLKTKKHYNSFTTDHFIESEALIKSLKETGKAVILLPSECKNLLQKPLVCFKCGESMANMPRLKEHLKTHLSNI